MSTQTNTPLRLGIIMDPIGAIKTAKDSSFAMLLAAQTRGWDLQYMELRDLFLADGRAWARTRSVEVRDQANDWHTLQPAVNTPLDKLDVILMRTDPPLTMDYLFATHILELAQARGTLVVNSPSGLRDVNEKLYTAWFPQCCVPSLVSADMASLRAFAHEHGEVIIKPLNGMGGASIFRISAGDPNTSVILETLTGHGRHMAMVQRFIPEIGAGDKRVLLIDGEPVPYMLARIPASGEARGNLAAGGRGEGQPLGERERWIASQVGPALAAKGLMFVGIDIIGDWLTEINVTSPTCIRELDRQFGLDIAGDLMSRIETVHARGAG